MKIVLQESARGELAGLSPREVRVRFAKAVEGALAGLGHITGVDVHDGRVAALDDLLAPILASYAARLSSLVKDAAASVRESRYSSGKQVLGTFSAIAKGVGYRPGHVSVHGDGSQWQKKVAGHWVEEQPPEGTPQRFSSIGSEILLDFSDYADAIESRMRSLADAGWVRRYGSLPGQPLPDEPWARRRARESGPADTQAKRYADEVEHGNSHAKDLTDRTRANMQGVAAIVRDAISRAGKWSGSSITVQSSVPLDQDAVALAPATDAYIVVHQGPCTKFSPGFLLTGDGIDAMSSGGHLGLGTFDDDRERADYWTLVKELRAPGSTTEPVAARKSAVPMNGDRRFTLVSEALAKAVPIGTVRQWKTGPHRKVAEGKWEPVPEGAKRTKKKAKKPEADKAPSKTTTDNRFPMAGDEVDGRRVRDPEHIPNEDSIGASLDDYTILPGIRTVPMDVFDEGSITGRHYSASGTKRIKELAGEIKASGEISPLIVVVDADGAYVLEGSTRVEALFRLDAVSFPAMVVVDNDNPPKPSGKTTADKLGVPLRAFMKTHELDRAPHKSIPLSEIEVDMTGDTDSHAVLTWKHEATGDKMGAYTPEFKRRNAAKKWDRLRKLLPVRTKAIRGLEGRMADKKLLPEQRDAAASMLLIALSGLRPGSAKGVNAKKPTYGINTLLKGNVKTDGSTISLDFIGKASKRNTSTVEHAALAKFIRARQKGKKKGDRLWSSGDGAPSKALDAVGMGKYKPKDFRSAVGTKLAANILARKKPPPPMPEKEKKAKRLVMTRLREVSEAVASRLGNTPAIARSAYISPAIIEAWMKKVGARGMLDKGGVPDVESFEGDDIIAAALMIELPGRLKDATVIPEDEDEPPDQLEADPLPKGLEG